MLAIQASLSGVFCFQHFHTFNLPALVNRLVEMGIARSIVAQSIRGIMSTRLVRKICEKCKEKVLPTKEQLKLLPPEMARVTFYPWAGL
jgi:type II secretory ATPase GspE/PulE/Tfp pilus assembly ATPase PilB-like protein